jgi:hypothetical protein
MEIITDIWVNLADPNNIFKIFSVPSFFNCTPLLSLSLFSSLIITFFISFFHVNLRCSFNINVGYIS